MMKKVLMHDRAVFIPELYLQRINLQMSVELENQDLQNYFSHRK